MPGTSGEPGRPRSDRPGPQPPYQFESAGRPADQTDRPAQVGPPSQSDSPSQSDPPSQSRKPAAVRAGRLERALREAVRGPVEFDASHRALVTMDASNYRRVPSGVVVPRDAEDVAATLAVCREHGVPVVPRGGGTSIAGQATGVGVVLDFTRGMNEILSLDPESRTAVVQPGVICDTLRAAAAPHGLTFGPDPSTHSRCTLGGMIGNNSCGSHSVAWGTTADNVHALRALTYRGAELRLGQGDEGVPEPLRSAVRALVDGDLALLRTGFPELPRRISGYALDALLPQAALWLHGHLHAPSDYRHLGCRVVANPLGYAGKGEQQGFAPQRLVEV